MKRHTDVRIGCQLQTDDLIVITGAGGFIAGALARYFHNLGFTRIRAIDRKPLPEWYQRVPGVECLSMDLSEKANAIRAVEGAAEVYNLAADMGGMGFIEHFRVECLRSMLVNTHLIDAAWRAGAERYFFSSSACAYNTDLQKDPHVRALKESDAYPAMSERGYGWEKLISEMFCQEYWAERGLETHFARFHNIYGPNGTWFGGREKAPAAICRKMLEAIDSGRHSIEIWGDGTQTRSFCFIDDCVLGIDQIMHSERPHRHADQPWIERADLHRRPGRAWSRTSPASNWRALTISNAPKGVAGRNSDNTFIRQVLDWEPRTTLRTGMEKTYAWIAGQFADRKAGKRVVRD